AILFAQAQGPTNMRFRDGRLGSVPEGWIVPQAVSDWGYSAELTNQGCADSGNCAVILPPAVPPSPKSFGILSQSFDATPYRGKWVRLRAWLKEDPTASGDRAQMWLRVDRSNQEKGFFDNMNDRPVTTARWRQVEITGAVDNDADKVHFGVMSIGRGKAWVGGVEFDVLRDATKAELAASRRSTPPRTVTTHWSSPWTIGPLVVIVAMLSLFCFRTTRRALLPAEEADAPRWSVIGRFGFRFVFCTLVLHALPNEVFWNFTPWVAVHVFHLAGDAVTHKFTGSGDTALDYIFFLCVLVMSLAIASIWSVLDRDRGNYRRLNAWMRIFVRYSLASTMLNYGFGKIFPL